jgi:hypothetical protein
VVLGCGLVEPLWKVVKRSSEASMRRSAAGCLWTVAEADIEERRRLAELMSASTFVDFISSVCGPLGGVGDKQESSELLIIGAQGIEVSGSPRDLDTAAENRYVVGWANGTPRRRTAEPGRFVERMRRADFPVFDWDVFHLPS